MSRGVIFDDVTDTSGNALPGISVTIFEEGTTTKATLYDARVGGNNLDNPLTTNDRGIFLAYLEPGSYDISVAAPTGTFVKPGVPALDPDDVNDLNDNIADINAALDLLDDTGALNALQTVDTLAELKAQTNTIGGLYRTKGRLSAGDTGAALYKVVSAGDYSGTPDEYGDHTDAGGNVLVLAEPVLIPDYFGAIVGDTANRGPEIRAFFQYLKKVYNKKPATANAGDYYADYFDIPSGIDFWGIHPASFGLGNEFGADYNGTVFRQHSSATDHFICFDVLPDASNPIDRIGPLRFGGCSIVADYSVGKTGFSVRSRTTAQAGLDNISSARQTIVQSMTIIGNIMIRNAGSHGMWYPAGHGGCLPTNINSYFNGGDGVFLDCSFGTQESTHFLNLDGDGNLGGATLRVYQFGRDLESDSKYSTLVITGIRSEKRVNTNDGVLVGNDNCIILDDCNSGTIIINGLYHQSIESADEPGDAIRLINNTSGFAPTVIYNGLEIAAKASKSQTPAGRGYALNDTVNGQTIPADTSSAVYSSDRAIHAVVSFGSEKPWQMAGSGAPINPSVMSGGTQMHGTSPGQLIYETDAGSNSKGWGQLASGGQLTDRLYEDDGGSPVIWRRISRSGTSVTLVEYLAPFRITTGFLELPGTPTYADEAAAAAGGLASGRIYKTAGGDLRVKL